jgi:hypothetical protein
MAIVKKKTNTDTLVAEWDAADKALAAAKAREKELREQVIEALFKDAPVGTNNHELPTGETLSCVKKLNYKLETDATMLAQGALAGMIGEFLTQRLVKWKPELSVSEYKKLDDISRATIDKALTITPATPSLEMKAKKS